MPGEKLITSRQQFVPFVARVTGFSCAVLVAAVVVTACGGSAGGPTVSTTAAPAGSSSPAADGTDAAGETEASGTIESSRAVPTPGSTPAPGGTMSPAPTKPLGPTSLTGTVEQGVESGCVVLLGEDGTALANLFGLDQALAPFGARVRVTGSFVPDMMTTCQQGQPFEVTDVALL